MSAALVLGCGLVFVPAGVGAVNAIQDTCADAANADSTICKNQDDNFSEIIKNVVNTLLFLLGIAAVIVIIIGGITYTTSAGNDSAVKRAKDMILYAVIGLVVAFLAFALVNFVINRFK